MDLWPEATALPRAGGRTFPPWGWVACLGQNAILLLGLNGLFFHHLDGPLAAAFTARCPAGGWAVFAYGLGVSALSMAAAVPAIRLLVR